MLTCGALLGPCSIVVVWSGWVTWEEGAENGSNFFLSMGWFSDIVTSSSMVLGIAVGGLSSGGQRGCSTTNRSCLRESSVRVRQCSMMATLDTAKDSGIRCPRYPGRNLSAWSKLVFVTTQASNVGSSPGVSCTTNVMVDKELNVSSTQDLVV